MKKLANESMTDDDCRPSHIPTANALRVAKCKHLSQNRSVDPIHALVIEKYNYPYHNFIKDIGIDKLYVHYWSTVQIHLYNLYCKKGYAKIAIDATGDVIRRINRPYNQKSRTILLYSAVINDPELQMQFSVADMLSERHDNVAIFYWLASWIKEIISDMSLALLHAVAKAFTSYTSVFSYIEYCYQIIFQNTSDSLPKVYIRCDIAHVIKSVTSWKCLKQQSKRMRHFYIRSICQLLLAKDIQFAENIIYAIFSVCLSETEDNIIGTDSKNECEVQKNWLRNLILYGVDQQLEKCCMETDYVAITPEITDAYQSPTKDNSKYCHSFVKWATTAKQRAESNIIEGDRDNFQYLPSLVDELLHLMRLYPLCSAIMNQFYKNSNSSTASSAIVESTFNNIKNRISTNLDLPLRLDNFVLKHIDHIRGV